MNNVSIQVYKILNGEGEVVAQKDNLQEAYECAKKLSVNDSSEYTVQCVRIETTDMFVVKSGKCLY